MYKRIRIFAGITLVFLSLAVSMIPAGKVGNPEQLAGTVLYLASPASDYLHGTIIRVDGGYMIW